MKKFLALLTCLVLLTGGSLQAAVLFLEAGTDATQDLKFYGTSYTSGGTIASASDQAHTGTRSLKADIPSSGAAGSTYAFIYTSSTVRVVQDAGAAVSFWARWSATPSDPAILASIADQNEVNDILTIKLNSTGVIRVSGIGVTAKNGTTVLSANTWYRISFAYVITTTTNWSVKVYVNGTLEITYTNADGTLTSATTYEAGWGLGGETTTPALSLWIDDIYIDDRTDQTDVGNISVTAKRPFANGTTNGFTGTGTPSGYGTGNARYVNEQPLSETNYVAKVGAGSATTEEYTAEGLTVGDANLTGASIKGVRGWVWTKSLAGETGKIVVDGTQTNISITSTAAMFTQNSATPTVYPAGTGTDIGEVTDTSLTTVTLYECGVLVAYTPAAAGSSGAAVKRKKIGND